MKTKRRYKKVKPRRKTRRNYKYRGGGGETLELKIGCILDEELYTTVTNATIYKCHHIQTGVPGVPTNPPISVVYAVKIIKDIIKTTTFYEQKGTVSVNDRVLGNVEKEFKIWMSVGDNPCYLKCNGFNHLPNSPNKAPTDTFLILHEYLDAKWKSLDKFYEDQMYKGCYNTQTQVAILKSANSTCIISDLFTKLIDGLKFLHEKIIVNRDIRPKNIMYCINDNNGSKTIDVKYINYESAETEGAEYYDANTNRNATQVNQYNLIREYKDIRKPYVLSPYSNIFKIYSQTAYDTDFDWFSLGITFLDILYPNKILKDTSLERDTAKLISGLSSRGDANIFNDAKNIHKTLSDMETKNEILKTYLNEADYTTIMTCINQLI